MWRGGLKNVTTCDKDGGGVKKSWDSCDVIYVWSLSEESKFKKMEILEFILQDKKVNYNLSSPSILCTFLLAMSRRWRALFPWQQLRAQISTDWSSEHFKRDVKKGLYKMQMRWCFYVYGFQGRALWLNRECQ